MLSLFFTTKANSAHDFFLSKVLNASKVKSQCRSLPKHYQVLVHAVIEWLLVLYGSRQATVVLLY